MVKISTAEKTILEKIAASDNKVLARRAMIILMSEGNALPDHIAKEVALTTQTVKRWLREFEEKRLNIFPDHIFDSQSVADAADTPETTAAETKKIPPQKKPKKSQTIKYPPRKKVGLKPADTLAEAGRKVIGFHFARMLQHEPGTRLGEDIEALHDMRVATRRMRAAFKVFGPGFSKKALKPLLKGLKATGRALGPVRDLDVFMEKLQRYQKTLPTEEQDGLQILLDMWETKRRTARKDMLAYLDSKKYLKFKRNLLEFVKTKGMGAKSIPPKVPPPAHQLRHVAPGLIYSAYEEVRAYETVLDNAPIETLHQLRISFKRFRYTLEYLQEILGDERKAVIQEVKAMQDHLGHLNDADVASEILRDFLADWETHQLHLPLTKRQSPAQIVSYLNTKLNERHELLVSFPKAWARFNRLEFKQNLAKAIAVL